MNYKHSRDELPNDLRPSILETLEISGKCQNVIH